LRQRRATWALSPRLGILAGKDWRPIRHLRKGHSLNAEHILGTADRARPFLGGPVLLARLAPVDYRHLHYPDDGSTLDYYWLWT
jgi:hypothetical protein